MAGQGAQYPAARSLPSWLPRGVLAGGRLGRSRVCLLYTAGLFSGLLKELRDLETDFIKAIHLSPNHTKVFVCSRVFILQFKDCLSLSSALTWTITPSFLELQYRLAFLSP